MTIETFKEIWEKNDDSYLQFKQVNNKTSNRSDVHAFNLLDKLVPGITDMVAAAEHDEIFLGVEIEDLAKVITEDQIIELIQCGVRFDENYDGLAMFV